MLIKQIGDFTMKIRVYDAGKKYADRYTMYFPYPKWMQKEDECIAYYYGFNFHVGFNGKSVITRYCSDYAMKPVACCNYGMKVRLSSLPDDIKKMISKIQTVWDILCDKRNRLNDEIWNAWNKDDLDEVIRLSA